MVTAYEKAKAEREAKDKADAKAKADRETRDEKYSGLEAAHENVTSDRARERMANQDDADRKHQASVKAKARGGNDDTGGERIGVTTAEAPADEGDLPEPIAAPGTPGASATNPKLALNYPPERLTPYGEGAAPPDSVRVDDDGKRHQTEEEKRQQAEEAKRQKVKADEDANETVPA